MSRPAIKIPIHGSLLKTHIKAKFKNMDEFSLILGVSRMTLHSYISSGKIPPRKLVDVVKILNLGSDDIQLLERKEQSAIEKKLIRLRECEDALIEIRKIIEGALPSRK